MFTLAGHALTPRGDRQAIRKLRAAWPELTVTRSHGTLRAFWWGSGVGRPVATGATPAELGAAIASAWARSGSPR